MTGSTSGPRVPGTTLLRIARRLFNEQLLSAVVQPTIADLQREVADAGSSRLERLHARWRGYRAFWTLLLVAPFASWALPAGDRGAVAFPDALARLAVASIILAFVAAVGPFFGAWVAISTAAGALAAIAIHVWYARHPSAIPAPEEPRRLAPQINYSSTEVAGNIGGLIFAVGSVLIVAIGLPAVIVFLFGGLVAGSFLAWGLVAWHASHPTYGLPENRIVLR